MLLMLLGLPEAKAATPVIDSFAPGSGVVGTDVVITGSGFTGTTDVSFNGVAAAFVIDSDAQITATVPAGATTGPIAVTNPDGTATSAPDFTVIVAPVISDFSPRMGEAGTRVIIVGSGFSGVSSVRFNGKNAQSFNENSDTRIRAVVPRRAGTGPIRVTNAAGADTSGQDFRYQKDKHRSRLTLFLDRHLVASGDVKIPDDTRLCQRGRRVVVQRRSSGDWRDVRERQSKPNGSYRINLPDREGTYRAFVRELSAVDDLCKPDVSRMKPHDHPNPGGGGGGGGGGDEIPPPPPPQPPCCGTAQPHRQVL